MQPIVVDGREILLPDVLACPVCRVRLVDHTDEYSRKHIRRCELSVAPVKTDHRPGRPSNRERAARLEDLAFSRKCSNCGHVGCKGGADGRCPDWEPYPLNRCMVCGYMPVLDKAAGRIECCHCGLSLQDDDMDRLLTKWAGRWLG